MAVLGSEIKAPLISVIDMASVMCLSSKIDDFERRSIQAIQKSGEDLLEIVNDSLEYSKLWSEPAQVDLAPIFLQETLTNVINTVESMAAVGNVGIDTCFDASVPAVVTTDGRRLDQILTILLENAIQHSEQEGTVKLGVSAVLAKEILPPAEVRRGKEEEAFLRFVIKDSRKQVMPKDHLNRIFDPNFNGAGVGMAVVSKLVEDLCGVLQVKSKVEGNTTTTVDIPVDGKPVDPAEVARKFLNTTVFIVGNETRDNLFLHMLAKYQVDMVKLVSCGDMDILVQTQKTIDKSRINICLVQEDLFNALEYQRLAVDAHTALLTFGPHRSVPGCKAHFPSLTRVLPFVIAKSMIACLEVLRINKDAFIRETQSSQVPRLKSFDYSHVRALIAEDSQINQKLLQRILQRKGVKHIDVVEDGQKAVDAVHLYKKDYDIIFMDNQMPTMDGIEACQSILARIQHGRRLPEIAFVTANLSDNFKRDALRAGGNGFIVKPITRKAVDEYFMSQIRLKNLVTVS